MRILIDIIFIYSATTSAEDWTLNQMFKPETKTSKINAHKKYGLKCKFSPDSKFLVTTSADHTAKLWDTSNQEYISVSFKLKKNQLLRTYTNSNTVTKKRFSF